MGKERRRITSEFKAGAIRLAEHGDKSTRAVAADLGIQVIDGTWHTQQFLLTDR
jgi:transposase-like protein